MDHNLAAFAATWLRVAGMALVPVILTAFVAIPFALGGHPGELSARAVEPAMHIT